MCWVCVCVCGLVCLCVCVAVCVWVVRTALSPDRPSAVPRDRPSALPPSAGPPKNVALFSSPAPNSFFLSLWWSSRGILVVFLKTTKIPREDAQEREERKTIVAGEGKKREILGSPPFGAPHPSEPSPFGAPQGPEGREARRVPRISRFLPIFRPIFALFVSLRVSSRGILVVLEAPGH